ncbi:MAG: GGDEF domain-containing protein, partial [Chromatocurvus sp.]
LIGSYHMGLSQEAPGGGRAELKLLQSLTHGVALALQRALRQQQADALMLLDAETGVGNRRAFRRVLGREIARCRRSGEPMSMLLLKVDNLDDLHANHGEAACRFLMRRLAQRLTSCLRETDHISRVEGDGFGLLLPACSEPHGHDIGERLCGDIRDFAIDDGRGGVFHTTLSVGIVSWDPATLPSDSRERLVALFEAEAVSALAKTVTRGGNGVSISRLGALMI